MAGHRAACPLAALALRALVIGCAAGPRAACASGEAGPSACASAHGPECEPEAIEAAEAGVVLLQTQLQRQRRGTPGVQVQPHDSGAVRGESQRGSPEQPHSISQAFVFLFEWSWEDVAKECEAWLGPKGFAAALVSPPNEHAVGNSWFMRYQPVSYNLTSRSGNEAQFVDMVRRCRAVGVGIYVDAVFNHCAPMSGVGVAGSRFGFRSYPLYGPQDFHHQGSDPSTNCGVSDYHDLHNVQYCDLQGMPDLCTGCPHVQEAVATYLNRLALLGVAGFRVDAAKHMDAGELYNLLGRVNSSLFRFLEINAVPGEVVQTPMYFFDGVVTEFGFASTLEPKFEGEGLLRDDLKKFGEDWGLVPSDKAVVFLDNHDTQRNGQAPLTFQSGDMYVLLNIFMLAYPYGYPKVMSSYRFASSDQGPPSTPVHGPNSEVRCGPGQPWVCEHRLVPIANMVAWRRAAGASPVQNFASDGNRLSFCRGAAACVALNRKGASAEVKVEVSLPDGEYCDILHSSDVSNCSRVLVKDGSALLQLPPVGAVAFHEHAVPTITAAPEEASALPPEDVVEDTVSAKDYTPAEPPEPPEDLLEPPEVYEDT